MREGNLCCKSWKFGGKRGGYCSITTSTLTDTSVLIPHSIPALWLSSHSFSCHLYTNDSPPEIFSSTRKITSSFWVYFTCLLNNFTWLPFDQFITMTKTKFIIFLPKLTTFRYYGNLPQLLSLSTSPHIQLIVQFCQFCSPNSY